MLVLDGLGDFSQSQFVEHGSLTSDFTGFANKDENLAFDDMLRKIHAPVVLLHKRNGHSPVPEASRLAIR